MTNIQNVRKPVLEHDFVRDPRLGYEPEGSYGFLRYLSHGVPNPLVRWHYHDEYELHLIMETRGKVFVGDYIGHFEPGHLVLTGPRLPHNWISSDIPPQGVAVRDIVLQFADQPLRRAAEQIPELGDIMTLLERSRHGVEFFGLSDLAMRSLENIRVQRGLRRFTEFLNLLEHLSECKEYRLLSSTPLQSCEDDASLLKISNIVDYITENCCSALTLGEVSARAGMSESQFSRNFRRATGNTFTDFVNRLRVARACQLLMETDYYIANVCYESGFNNVANFNRRFLQLKGMTPKEFRRQIDARFGANH